MRQTLSGWSRMELCFEERVLEEGRGFGKVGVELSSLRGFPLSPFRAAGREVLW